MSEIKNQYFDLVESQLGWNVHRQTHNNPVEHADCEFCRNWIEAAQLDHVSEAVEVSEESYE